MKIIVLLLIFFGLSYSKNLEKIIIINTDNGLNNTKKVELYKKMGYTDIVKIISVGDILDYADSWNRTNSGSVTLTKAGRTLLKNSLDSQYMLCKKSGMNYYPSYGALSWANNVQFMLTEHVSPIHNRILQSDYLPNSENGHESVLSNLILRHCDLTDSGVRDFKNDLDTVKILDSNFDTNYLFKNKEKKWGDFTAFTLTNIANDLIFEVGNKSGNLQFGKRYELSFDITDKDYNESDYLIFSINFIHLKENGYNYNHRNMLEEKQKYRESASWSSFDEGSIGYPSGFNIARLPDGYKTTITKLRDSISIDGWYSQLFDKDNHVTKIKIEFSLQDIKGHTDASTVTRVDVLNALQIYFYAKGKMTFSNFDIVEKDSSMYTTYKDWFKNSDGESFRTRLNAIKKQIIDYRKNSIASSENVLLDDTLLTPFEKFVLDPKNDSMVSSSHFYNTSFKAPLDPLSPSFIAFFNEITDVVAEWYADKQKNDPTYYPKYYYLEGCEAFNMGRDKKAKSLGKNEGNFYAYVLNGMIGIVKKQFHAHNVSNYSKMKFVLKTDVLSPNGVYKFQSLYTDSIFDALIYGGLDSDYLDPREVILLQWQYGGEFNMQHTLNGNIFCLEDLLEKDFSDDKISDYDFFAFYATDDGDNVSNPFGARAWSRIAKKYDNCKGIMVTPWDYRKYDISYNAVVQAAYYGWLSDKDLYHPLLYKTKNSNKKGLLDILDKYENGDSTGINNLLTKKYFGPFEVSKNFNSFDYFPYSLYGSDGIVIKNNLKLNMKEQLDPSEHSAIEGDFVSRCGSEGGINIASSSGKCAMQMLVSNDIMLYGNKNTIYGEDVIVSNNIRRIPIYGKITVPDTVSYYDANDLLLDLKNIKKVNDSSDIGIDTDPDSTPSHLYSGVYHFDALKYKSNSEIIIDCNAGPVEIIVNNGIIFHSRSKITIKNGTPSDVIFYVLDGDITIGHDTEWKGTIFAPFSKIEIYPNNNSNEPEGHLGAFFGKEIYIEESSDGSGGYTKIEHWPFAPKKSKVSLMHTYILHGTYTVPKNISADRVINLPNTIIDNTSNFDVKASSINLTPGIIIKHKSKFSTTK